MSVISVCEAQGLKKKKKKDLHLFFFSLGTKGRNKGEFTNLQGVAASSQGKVLIADSNNQCVQVSKNLINNV